MTIQSGILALGLSALLSSGASAAVIAGWNFDDGDLLADAGSGTLVSNAPSLGYVDDAPGDKSLEIRGAADNGRTLTFGLDLSNLRDLVMTFDARRNTPGFKSNTVSYSVDGGTSFTPIATFNPSSSAFTSWTINLEDEDAIELLSDVRIRITFDGATNPGGFARLDNVQFHATPAPEAGGALLWLAGAMIVLSRRRLARNVTSL